MEHRLAVMGTYRQYVEAGLLANYGVDTADLSRAGAGQVEQILKGASPADMPIQQPTKFELILNLKTAKSLGLTMPASLVARADEVIE
jgi:putative ABC transport system substrate-binding protein